MSEGGLTEDDLDAVSSRRVFFGHQSVGMNILDAVPGVYAVRGLRAPPIEFGDSCPDQDSGLIRHAFIGQNERPRLKIGDFDAKVRSGIGERADVALMKFCYADITTETDADALFAEYRETLDFLRRDFPGVAFLHVTVPLMARRGRLPELKGRLTGNHLRHGAAENAARERLNVLIRREYRSRDVFDLAAIESTGPDGGRAAGTYRGQRFYHLHDDYASDPGHLNVDGARIAAEGWLRSIARVSAK